jgi:predicted nucleic acid-binding Zn ribbon protein
VNRRDKRFGDGPVPLAESLRVFSERMGTAAPDVLRVVFGHWEEVVGPAMSAHVRPLRLQETTLVVVADQPAWATQVRHLASDVLARLRDVCGSERAPEHLEVRVRR